MPTTRSQKKLKVDADEYVDIKPTTYRPKYQGESTKKYNQRLATRAQAKENSKTERKTRARDEYEPVRKAQLQHKIKGRNVFFAQFKANKIYQYDKIKTFVQEMQAKFRESNEVKTIQLRVELKTQEQYSTKVFDINDEILYQDPTNLYTAEDNDITGFTILIS